MSVKFTFALGAALFAVMLASSALGQVQSTEQQKCINALNKNTCKVAAKQGKENFACVRAGTKGTASPLCLSADSKGKVGNAAAKTTADESNNDCLGVNAPDFGYAPAGAGNAAAILEEQKLFEDTYGTTDPTAVISTTKVNAQCQLAVTKDLEKLIAAKWKVYVKCKKNVLKNGAISAAALEACLASVPADPKVVAKINKLNADISNKCGPPVVISTLFPGDCAGETLATLGSCLEARAECRICQALNITDDLSVNCDLFDDGIANGSCSSPGQRCGGPRIPCTGHQCVLAGAGASTISLHTAALPVPLVFNVSGDLDFASDDAGTGSGLEDTDCEINTFNPINIPSIGFVCVTPGPVGVCLPGDRWCGTGTGPALGIDWHSDGSVGACTSNTACTTACAAQCAALGSFNMVTGQCTGFCSGPTVQACTTDAQCASTANGTCNGPDPTGANSNLCQCHCINTAAHGPSDPGELQCHLSAHVNVENAVPCDGIDILTAVGDMCIPLSTQRASADIVDTNFVSGGVVPPSPNVNDQSGNPVSCADLVSTGTSGLVAVGVVNSFGSNLGDVSVGMMATCQ